ncbi:phage tail protein I [Alteromonas sp. a30]|uniref:phage tail protein I n=1 Tax=Alteromonas sp. a30 TaxID=2730917 RepID=UPI002283197C|nr:phage tail protein I [Alteromonas sp. a30]MCY7297559.1 phage tail protein I [Alteromonas sp. a30]
MPSLLPPNATAFELAAEGASARIGDVPVPNAELWNPFNCPAHLLPWLAWALSIDEWDSQWPESTQRQFIANSVAVHKNKGTLGAVKRALAALNINTEITEWYESDGPAGTFTVAALIDHQGIDSALINNIDRIVQSHKRHSAHYTLSLALNSTANNAHLLGSTSASTVTVEPWTLLALHTETASFLALGTISAAHSIIEAYPL